MQALTRQRAANYGKTRNLGETTKPCERALRQGTYSADSRANHLRLRASMLSQISAGASPKWNDLTYESSSRGSRRIDALPRLTSHKPEDFWGVSVPCKVPSMHTPFALPHLSAQTI